MHISNLEENKQGENNREPKLQTEGHRTTWSSSSVNGRLLRFGSSWLNHLKNVAQTRYLVQSESSVRS